MTSKFVKHSKYCSPNQHQGIQLNLSENNIKNKLKQLRSFTSSTVTDNIWFLVIKLEDIANADVGPVSFVFLGLLDSDICQVILPEQQKIINTNLLWNKSLEYSLIWK